MLTSFLTQVNSSRKIELGEQSFFKIRQQSRLILSVTSPPAVPSFLRSRRGIVSKILRRPIRAIFLLLRFPPSALLSLARAVNKNNVSPSVTRSLVASPPVAPFQSLRPGMFLSRSFLRSTPYFSFQDSLLLHHAICLIAKRKDAPAFFCASRAPSARRAVPGAPHLHSVPPRSAFRASRSRALIPRISPASSRLAIISRGSRRAGFPPPLPAPLSPSPSPPAYPGK